MAELLWKDENNPPMTKSQNYLNVLSKCTVADSGKRATTAQTTYGETSCTFKKLTQMRKNTSK